LSRFFYAKGYFRKMKSSNLLVGIITLMILAACGDSDNESIGASEETQDSVVSEPSAKKEEIQQPKIEGISPIKLDSLRVRKKFNESAQNFWDAYKDGNFDIYVRYLHPTIIRSLGGTEEFKRRAKAMKAQDPYEYEEVMVGPVDSMSSARNDRGDVTGWYCVMPIRRWVKGAPADQYQLQVLAGQTTDHGKNCVFADITNMPKEKILLLMPDMRFLFRNIK